MIKELVSYPKKDYNHKNTNFIRTNKNSWKIRDSDYNQVFRSYTKHDAVCLAKNIQFKKISYIQHQRINNRSYFIINPAEVEKRISQTEFNFLSTQWKKETAHFSTVYHKINNPNYLKIIGEGWKVVPFIIRDLKESPDLWHEALYYITKENPVKPRDLNDIGKIREAWLNWAANKNIE